MAGKTLYFVNQAQRTVWPVDNVISEPTTVDVARKSDPYRNTFQTAMKLPMAGVGTTFVPGEVVMPGVLTKLEASIYAVGGTYQMVPTVGTPSDEVSGHVLRQDPLNHTHWQVTVDPSEFWTNAKMLISMEEYPDGYSNRAPSWWTDPKAT